MLPYKIHLGDGIWLKMKFFSWFFPGITVKLAVLLHFSCLWSVLRIILMVFEASATFGFDPYQKLWHSKCSSFGVHTFLKIWKVGAPVGSHF